MLPNCVYVSHVGSDNVVCWLWNAEMIGLHTKNSYEQPTEKYRIAQKQIWVLISPLPYGS